MERVSSGFDEVGARDRTIACGKPSGVRNQKSSASRSISMGPARFRQPTGAGARGMRESAYFKGWGA